MKISILIITLIAATALAALGQEGAVEDVKPGAKEAGQTVKNGVKTAGEKTKETAQTVDQKTKESAKAVHRKSKRALNKPKTGTDGQQSTNQTPNTPSPTDR